MGKVSKFRQIVGISMLATVVTIASWVGYFSYCISYSQSCNVVIEGSKISQTMWGISKSQFVGSGVIVSADGYIVTAAHCLKGVTALKVTLHDGSQYKVTEYFVDPNVDFGIIKLPITSKYFRPLADSNVVDGLIYNVGNARGVWDDSWFIGSVYRNHFKRDIVCADNEFLFLKIGIFPGCSGGGIYKYGNLVGVVSRGGMDACFAIPSNLIKERWGNCIKRTVGDLLLDLDE